MIVRLTEEYLRLSNEWGLKLPSYFFSYSVNHSLFPLLEAAYTPHVEQVCRLSDINTLQRFIYFSLESDLEKSTLEEVTNEMEYILCLRWHAPIGCTAKVFHPQWRCRRECCVTMDSADGRETGMHPDEQVPSLQTIARVKLAVGGIGLKNAMKPIRDIVKLYV